MNIKKKIVVVGCGHWGKNLVRNFYELGALYCICEPNDNIANKLSNLYSVPNLSFDEVIKNSEIDGVVLAVPVQHHASMAIKAIEHGKHVYVEKPLAANHKEGAEIVKKAKEFSAHLMVGHLLQYHPAFIKLKDIVQSKVLGKIKYIYSSRMSFGKIRSFENVIWSFAPHDISMVLSLVSSELKEVRTESSCILQPDIEDIANLHMYFDSGIKAHITVSWLNPTKEQKLVVIGENGMIVFDDTKEWKEKLSLKKYNVDFVCEEPHLSTNKEEVISVPQAEPLFEECKYFIELLSEKVPPKTDGHEGLRVLKALGAFTESHKNQTSVKLK